MADTKHETLSKAEAKEFKAEAKAAPGYKGKLVRVDGNRFKMSHDDGSVADMHEVTDQTKITRDDKKATLQDLQPGDVITAHYLPNRAATEIVAVSASDELKQGDNVTVTGKIVKGPREPAKT